eukprot:3770748-Prymnesium_polylepis.1
MVGRTLRRRPTDLVRWRQCFPARALRAAPSAALQPAGARPAPNASFARASGGAASATPR